MYKQWKASRGAWTWAGFSYSLVRAKGAAVPDVFESGGVRENKLSLPPGRPVDKAVAWWESFPMHGSGMRGAVPESESTNFAGRKLDFYLLKCSLLV